MLLREVAATPLLRAFNLAGASIDHRGGLVVWAREPNKVMRFAPGLVPDGEWLLPDQTVPLAVWLDTDHLEVVTQTPAALHRIRLDGTPTEVSPVDIDGTLLRAARGEEGWWLLYESDGSGVLRFQGETATEVRAPLGELTIGPGDDWWVTGSRHPFEVESRSDVGDRRVFRPSAHVLDSMRASAGQADFSAWVSLPVVVLEGGYLQTISDLAYDRRLLVVYDRAGDVVSTLAVDVPLGMLVSARRGMRVYGARHTNLIEVIEYSYRWR